MDETHSIDSETNVNLEPAREENKESESSTQPSTRICLVGDVCSDEELTVIAQEFGLPVVTSETGAEYVDDDSHVTLFVLREFSGPVYEAIAHLKQRIVSPVVLRQCASQAEMLPCRKCPVYSLTMSGVIVCFTGFRVREDLGRLAACVHSMGGCIRRTMSTKVTHLVANCSTGEKYNYAVTFRVPIMLETWVTACWEQRNNLTAHATSEELMAHKLKLFHWARVCFYGFSDEEAEHMTEVLQTNGGVAVELTDKSCTHVVVDDAAVQNLPEGETEEVTFRAYIVKAEWFWQSIQNQVCASEKEYLFEDYLESMMSPNRSGVVSSTASNSSLRNRKRKRLRDTVSRLLQTYESPTVQKRRSSVSDAGLLSMSGSFLDSSGVSPDRQIDEDAELVSSDTPRKNLSARQQVFMELVQTESNYVKILETIMLVYKAPLEDRLEIGDPLLSKVELNTIFGNLGPIYDIHKKMLADLRYAYHNWREDFSIGEIFLKFAPDLMKAYPSFVNFFECTKEMLLQCDQTRPRFHAFLKVGQMKPECGRQSLQELLIRPVQRLPSISLLLNDIQKHTTKSNPDHAALEHALSKIREVMTYINEDKRKTESQMEMFGIYNEIDYCPAYLVSSQRHFVVRSEVMELSEGLSGRGDILMLYLFTDVLEVCKRRSKVFNSMKRAGSTLSLKQSNCKPYKHIRLIPLTYIKKVIDIQETDDCHKVFALMCRNPPELKGRVISFTVLDDEADKVSLLKTFCRQVANAFCRTDAELAGHPFWEEAYVATMSVQPTRNNICSSMTMPSCGDYNNTGKGGLTHEDWCPILWPCSTSSCDSMRG